jgi:hypothetical protein
LLLLLEGRRSWQSGRSARSQERVLLPVVQEDLTVDTGLAVVPVTMCVEILTNLFQFPGLKAVVA